MATKRRNRASGVWTAIYVVILILWILFLCACGLYVLNEVWEYASVYDQTQIDPVIEDYFNRLQTNMWTDGMDVLVRTMPHPTKTDAEVKELIQTTLRQNPLSYAVKPGFARSDSVTYNILCGANIIGEVILTHDTTVNLVKDIDLPSAVVGVLAKMGVAIQPELYPWKVAGESYDFAELGLYSSVRVTVPENYRVEVDGVTLGPEYIIETGIKYDNLTNLYYEYEGLPTKVTYKQLDEATRLSYTDFINGFADKFLLMRSNTIEPMYAYSQLQPYIKQGTDMDNRLQQSMIDTWSHNSYYQFNGSQILRAYEFVNQLIIIEFHAEASAQQPAGPNEISSDFRAVIETTSGSPQVIWVEDI